MCDVYECEFKLVAEEKLLIWSWGIFLTWGCSSPLFSACHILKLVRRYELRITTIDWRERERERREKSHWNENTPHVPSQVRRANNTDQRLQVTGREKDERGCSSMWLWGFKLIEISDNYSKLIRHELGWWNKIIQFYSCDFLVLRQRFLSVFIRGELGIKCNNFHFIFLFLTWAGCGCQAVYSDSD